MDQSLALVPLPADVLEAIRSIPALMQAVSKLAPDVQGPLSAQKAARLVKRRTFDVLKALKAGELPAKFIEGKNRGRGRYEIRASDALAWAERAKAK